MAIRFAEIVARANCLFQQHSDEFLITIPITLPNSRLISATTHLQHSPSEVYGRLPYLEIGQLTLNTEIHTYGSEAKAVIVRTPQRRTLHIVLTDDPDTVPSNGDVQPELVDGHNLFFYHVPQITNQASTEDALNTLNDYQPLHP